LFIWRASPAQESGSHVTVGTVEIEGSNVYVRASDGRLQLIDIAVGKKRMKGFRIPEYFKKRKDDVLK
jgi:hypothetical protein